MADVVPNRGTSDITKRTYTNVFQNNFELCWFFLFLRMKASDEKISSFVSLWKTDWLSQIELIRGFHKHRIDNNGNIGIRGSF